MGLVKIQLCYDDGVNGSVCQSVKNNIWNNLVSWWSFDETSGTRLDLHSTNHLTDSSSVGYATGLNGNGANFVSSSSDYLQCASATGIPSASDGFSFVCWFKNTTYPDAGTIDTVFKVGSLSSGSEYSYALVIPVLTKRPAALIGATGSGGTYSDTNGTVINENQWYFAHAYYDPTSTTIGFGLNDETPALKNYSTAATANSPITVGRGSSSAHPGGEFVDAVVDNIAIFNGVLSNDERAWLYNGGLGRTYDEL